MRIEDDLGRAHSQGRGEEERVDKRSDAMLPDLFPVREQISELVIRNGLEPSVNFQRRQKVIGMLFQGLSGLDGLEVSRLANGLDLLKVLPDGIGGDEDMDGFNFPAYLLRYLDVNNHLARLTPNAHFQRSGIVQSSFEATADKFIGEGGDDANVGLHFDINNRNDLALDHLGDLVGFFFFNIELDHALGGQDHGDRPFDVDRETNFRGSKSFDFHGLDSLGELEGPFVSDGVLFKLLSKLGKHGKDSFVIHVDRVFHIEHPELLENFGCTLLTADNVQRLGELLELFLNRLAGHSVPPVEVHDGIDPFIHTLGISGPGPSIDSDGRAIDSSALRVTSRDDADGTLDPGEFLVDDEIQVLDKLTRVVVVRVVHAKVERFDQGHQRLDLLADQFQFRDLGVLQTLEGRVNKSSNFLGRFQPGPNGDLLQIGGRGLGPGQNGDSGHSDLGVVSGVINDAQEDGPDMGRFQFGSPLHGVDGQGPDDLVVPLVGNDFGEDLDRFDMSEFTNGSDDVQPDLLALLAFKLLLQELDVLLDRGRIPLAESTVDPDREQVPMSGMDASLVEQVGHLDEGNAVNLATIMGQRLQVFLDQLDQFLEKLLGGGPDTVQSSLDHGDSLGIRDPGDILDAFLDKHNSGIGTNHGDNIVEQVPDDLSLVLGLGLDFGLQFGLDLFQLGIAQRPQGLSSNAQVSSNVSLRSTAFGAFESFLGNALQLVNDLTADFLFLHIDSDQHIRSGLQIRLGQDRSDTSLLLNLVLFFLGELLAQGLLAGHGGLGVFEVEGLVLLLGGRGGHGGLGRFFLQEGQGDAGLVDQRFFNLPSGGTDHFSVGNGLPDDEVTDVITANDVVDGGDVLEMKGKIR